MSGATIDDLKEQYRMYISNPEHTRGVNYSLWIDRGEDEYLVMSSNTGGFVTFNSTSKDVGTPIQLTNDFFELLSSLVDRSLSWSFRPLEFFEHSGFVRTVAENVYDGKTRDYESWLAVHLAQHFVAPSSQRIPELDPLAEFAQQHTDADIPYLNNE